MYQPHPAFSQQLKQAQAYISHKAQQSSHPAYCRARLWNRFICRYSLTD